MSDQRQQSASEHELVKIARVRPLSHNGITRVRLSGISSMVTFIGTFCVATMVGGFAYPFVALSFNPQPVPVWIVAGAPIAVLSVALALALRRRRRIRNGDDDLVIDDQTRTISLPLGFGRTAPTTIDFDEIVEIACADELPAHPDVLDAHTFGEKRYVKRRLVWDDDLPDVGHRSEMRHAVVIHTRAGENRDRAEPIVRWSEAQRAHALAKWLTLRLGLASATP